MKIVLDVVGVLLVLPGIIFFLQGINVLPGSFMTGQNSVGHQWRHYGHHRGRAALVRQSPQSLILERRLISFPRLFGISVFPLLWLIVFPPTSNLYFLTAPV